MSAVWQVWRVEGARLGLVKEFFEENRRNADRHAWELLLNTKENVTFEVRRKS